MLDREVTVQEQENVKPIVHIIGLFLHSCVGASASESNFLQLAHLNPTKLLSPSNWGALVGRIMSLRVNGVSQVRPSTAFRLEEIRAGH